MERCSLGIDRLTHLVVLEACEGTNECERLITMDNGLFQEGWPDFPIGCPFAWNTTLRQADFQEKSHLINSCVYIKHKFVDIFTL